MIYHFLKAFYPFEKYSKIASNKGDIGYLGQWYLPPSVTLAYSIKNRDIQLVNYYLLRFVDINKRVEMLSTPSMPIATVARILLSLSDEYFVEAKDLIITYLTPFAPLPALDDIDDHFDLAKLHNIFTMFKTDNNFIFSMIPKMIINYIKNSKIITKSLVAKLAKASNDLDQYFINYTGYHFYRAIINIVLNKDINIANLNNIELRELAILATSVLNSKVITKLIAQLGTFHIDRVASEVLYDLDYYNNATHKAYSIINFSIYLSNNNRIDKICPLKKLAQVIKANKKSGITPANRIKITDAETAMRLKQVIDVKSYLAPATEFDKDLMIQFGLL